MFNPRGGVPRTRTHHINADMPVATFLCQLLGGWMVRPAYSTPWPWPCS